MARGFESKDVEFQQAEAERKKSSVRALAAGERHRDGRQRTIELALVRARNELVNAARPAHRAMLERAIEDLEAQLDARPPSTRDRHS
jgi:hypothetical protein